jgi:hypothetical protein
MTDDEVIDVLNNAITALAMGNKKWARQYVSQAAAELEDWYYEHDKYPIYQD